MLVVPWPLNSRQTSYVCVDIRRADMVNPASDTLYLKECRARFDVRGMAR